MTFLGFELLPIRANMLGTLAFVGADTCDAPFGAGVGSPARTGNLLLYKVFGPFEETGWEPGIRTPIT